YGYTWNTNPQQNAATATGLPAGPWTVVLTDANNCTIQDIVTLSNPALLTVTLDSTDVLCFGDATGTATANPQGGTGNYSYNWNTSPSQNTQTATGLPIGTYSVVVTDDNGCITTGSILVA